MSAGGVLDRVQKIVVQVAGSARVPDDPGPDTPLARGGFWLDSVDLVEIAVACEHEFGVIFDGEGDLTPDTLYSPRSLADLVRRKQAA